MRKIFNLTLLLAIILIGSQKFALAAEPIKVDGSSTVFPITEAVAEEFGKKGGAKAMVGISGTGGGFKRFCRGETHISDASRPIKQKEIDACREGGVSYEVFEVAFDGLSVVVNPANNWVDSLTLAELKKIWEPGAQGKITKWSQVRDGFPDKPITLFGPGTDSGTFDYFTETINGKSGASRGDYTASEDDNVLVEGVASDEGAIGYFGLSYYEENKNKLKAVAIKASDASQGVLPSKETVLNKTYTPLSRPLYIYVNKAVLKNKPDIKKFVQYYLEQAPKLSEEVGYVPLPENEYATGLNKLNSL